MLDSHQIPTDSAPPQTEAQEAAPFVHLRVHSAYSLSEGAIRIKELVESCRGHGMPAVAVTDTNNLFGALEFAKTAAAAGIQPIVGCQLDLAPEAARAGAAGHANGNGKACGPERVVLLVQDETGYRNLLKLVSRAYLAEDERDGFAVTWADLEALGEGLIALSAGPDGPVGRRFAQRDEAGAAAAAERLAELFPGRFYLEVSRFGLPVEALVEPGTIELAYRLGLPLVATNEAFFLEPSMYEAHDALICIAEGSYVAETERRRLTPHHRLKTPAEMAELFADLPEALANTAVVARRCSYFPEKVRPILPAYPTVAGRTEAEELRAKAAADLERRLEAHVWTAEQDGARREEIAKPYRERLDYELGIIEQMGFPGYFLIVADIIQWAKGQGIPVGPGRGSGAGSVVAWALTITDLDPLRYGLLFERFLNPDRVSMPDFDIDFCQDRRDEVIRYVQERYGRDRVAQIITFGKLQARAVLRDVGRVLQMPYGQVDRLCKLVPNNPANPVTLAQAIEGEPALQHEREADETVARLMDVALKLEGLYRNASTHAAGMVIGDRALDELVPLYRDPRSDMPVTQFNMKHVEDAGLVKFDFLGLKTLSVIARATELVRETEPDFDLAKIPDDDPETYRMMARGDTLGVFQLESSGMRDVLKRLKPDRFEDIIAVVSLYRPGPMDNIPSYIARKHGTEAPDYLHPSLEWILKETHGIMIYQEQVMQIAQELSGYSLGQADLLRRAMGKKIKAEMEAQQQGFVEGALARDVPRRKAEEIFALVDKFAGYGFNKSHAAAYARVALETAYLKAHHPVAFLAASMSYDAHNTDKLNLFKQELERLKHEVLPPDVNRSGADFELERRPDDKAAVRYALAAVKNVGEAAMEVVVAERRAHGPFRSLADFAIRVDAQGLNKRQVENLARAGAFDSLDPNRRRVFEGAERIVRNAVVAASERGSDQANLFGGLGETPELRLELPEVEDWPLAERLAEEAAAVGFYLSAHPLDGYEEALKRLGVTAISDLAAAQRAEAGFKRLAGVILSKQERRSKRGNRFAYVQLSDKTGAVEIQVFSEQLAQAREMLEPGESVLVTAGVELGDAEDEVRVVAQDVERLDEAVAGASDALRLYLASPAPLEPLAQVLNREDIRGGRARLTMVLRLDDGQEVELELPERYRLSAEVRRAIKATSGLQVESA